MTDQPRPLTTPPAAPPGVTIIEIGASYSITINVGNYEKVESFQHIKATIDPGADIPAAQRYINEQAKLAARAAVLPALGARQNQTDSIWNSLPDRVKKELEGKY